MLMLIPRLLNSNSLRLAQCDGFTRQQLPAAVVLSGEIVAFGLDDSEQAI